VEIVLETSDYISRLREAIIHYDADEVTKVSKEGIKSGVDPVKAIEKGFAVGIREMGERFQRFEIFLPHLVLASDATTDAMKILVAAIPEDRIGLVKRGGMSLGRWKGTSTTWGRTWSL
jgi:methanogenic corrinoid protein MtbC1